jgi:hypothetical protein
LLPLLNILHADQQAALTATAAGRNAGLVALAETTATLAASIADLDEKICPIVRELDRSRTDRRWHQFQATSNAASRYAGRLSDTISAAAAEALLVVTDLEPVRYCGSITARHGTYVLAGPCDCYRCRYNRGRLRLCRPFENVSDVTCVRPGSVTAAPLHEPTGLPTQTFATALRRAIRSLPTPAGPASYCPPGPRRSNTGCPADSSPHSTPPSRRGTATASPTSSARPPPASPPSRSSFATRR